MPYYRATGSLPRQRHTQLRGPDGRLCYEELMGEEGFSSDSSLLYHRNIPSTVVDTRVWELPDLSTVPNHPLRPLHFSTHALFEDVSGVDAVTGRRLLLGNGDVRLSYVVADDPSPYYRNAIGDECLYIEEGEVEVQTIFGDISAAPGDYLIVPRATTHRIVPKGTVRIYTIEANSHIGPPKHFLSKHGQLLEHAPYCERDLRVPTDPRVVEGSDVEVFIKHRGASGVVGSVHVLPHHPFDVVGWDGCLYPYAFNVNDYMPLTGKVHQPPPAHIVWEGTNFVVCNFVPRKVDYHPLAIPVPYYHSNVDSDEVMFYCGGDYEARKGSGSGRARSVLHPGGHAHGPQPGAYERSIGAEYFDELAVMVDTFRPLELGEAGRAADDGVYQFSWARGDAGRSGRPTDERHDALRGLPRRRRDVPAGVPVPRRGGHGTRPACGGGACGMGRPLRARGEGPSALADRVRGRAEGSFPLIVTAGLDRLDGVLDEVAAIPAVRLVALELVLADEDDAEEAVARDRCARDGRHRRLRRAAPGRAPQGAHRRSGRTTCRRSSAPEACAPSCTPMRPSSPRRSSPSWMRGAVQGHGRTPPRGAQHRSADGVRAARIPQPRHRHGAGASGRWDPGGRGGARRTMRVHARGGDGGHRSVRPPELPIHRHLQHPGAGAGARRSRHPATLPGEGGRFMRRLDSDENPLFGLENLPYGVYSADGGPRRVAARLGDQVVDIGLVLGESGEDEAFLAPTLNPFMAQGRERWVSVRSRLQDALTAPVPEAAIHALDEVALHLPFDVADYVDFYASEHHAANLGRLFRPDAPDPLPPNWRHLPIGYHGRSGSIVVSGTDIVRPSGQRRDPGEAPTFGPSVRLDIEAEVGFVLGVGSAGGTSIPSRDADEHVFGAFLFNDWSARDIQAWEYVPLGPNLGKSFASTVSAWVIPLLALEGARVPTPVQDPPVMPYLSMDPPWGLDIALEVEWNGEVVSRPPYAAMYWSPAQMLAHLTVNGAPTRTGDVFASGTVSGPERGERGAFIELTWAGAEPVVVGGVERVFLADGDIVVLRGSAPGPHGTRLGFGEARGRIVPTLARP